MENETRTVVAPTQGQRGTAVPNDTQRRDVAALHAEVRRDMTVPPYRLAER